jgi:hypothetical protein
MLLLALVLVAVAVVAVTAPLRSADHPGGFTPAFRDVTVVVCLLAAAGVAVLGVRALRVVLIIDQTRLVIRNQGQTTVVRWEARPRFELRGWHDSSTITAPGEIHAARTTHRFRGVVCVANGHQTMIAATARMTRRDRVEELLGELRAAAASAQAARPSGGNG